MKILLCLATFLVLASLAYTSGHGGISVKIPLPLIKLRFIDIAQLFKGHEGGGEGGHGGGIGFGGFGLELGGHGHHGW